MKNLITKSIAIMGLFFMLAVGSAHAQTPASAEVNIPFDFSAGKAILKAGAYRIKQRAGNVLAISSADGKKTMLLDAPLTIGSRDFKAGSRLVFNRYDDQYFLSQVWLNADMGRQLFTSGAETRAAREYRLAKKKVRPERVEIAVIRR
jgi:hypothetical protein